MKKPFVILTTVFATLVVVIVILVCVIINYAKQLREVPVTPVEQVATTTPSAGIKAAPMTHEASTSTYYTLDMTYPKSSEVLLPEIYNFVDAQKSEFLSNFDNLTHDDVQMMRLDQSEWNFVVSTKTYTSKNTVSYVIDVYSYTGGAHGITTSNTFVYNTSSKLLSIEDILKNTPDLYTKLSTKARAYFRAKFPKGDANSLEDGTKPEHDAFNAWYLTNTDLIFLFGQYSIGPYVLGIQEFPLNKSKNQDMFTGKY